MDLLNEIQIHIIVSDVLMPKLDGLSLLKMVKEKYPHIQRLMLTAKNDPTTAILAIEEADVFGFITKPWNKNYLIRYLKMAAKMYELNSSEKNHLIENIYVLVQIGSESIIIPNLDDDCKTSIKNKIDSLLSGFYAYEEMYDEKYMEFENINLCKNHIYNVYFYYFDENKSIIILTKDKNEKYKNIIFGMRNKLKTVDTFNSFIKKYDITDNKDLFWSDIYNIMNND